MSDREALRDALLMEIAEEYERAIREFPTLNSRHEGYAVILEELDEVWDDIKENKLNATLEPEVIQVGAMVLRFLMDCIYQSSNQTARNEDE